MAFLRRRSLRDGSLAYIVRWYDAAGEEQTKQFSRASSPHPAQDAKDFKIRVEAELQAGTYVDPRAGQITVREYVEDWTASLHQRRTTADRLNQILNLHVLPLIGSMRLGAVRRRDIQGMVNALSVKPIGGRRGADNPRPALAGSYVANIYEITASIFRAAVLDQLIPTSPCQKIHLPERSRPPIIIPTPDQVAHVANVISPRYAGLVMLAAGTGLRSGEIRGLDLARLRVLERTVVVDRQLHTPDSGPHYYGPPKTRAGFRTVPLTASYAEEVSTHLARWGTGTDGLVFTNRSQRPITRKALASALGPILDDLGFPPRSGLHIFRHYYVSGLVAAGLDVVTVMRRVGHSSSVETLETYGHLWHDREEATAAAVEASFPTGHRDRIGTGKTAAGPRPSGNVVTPLTERVRINRQVTGDG